MGQVVLAGQGEPFGQGVEHAPEFELAHHLLQVSRELPPIFRRLPNQV
jgi:hypothetical protein